MSTEMNPSPSFWARLKRALVNILRFLLILGIITGVAAALYYGMPYLYEKFILPVETNTARLSEVENKQTADVALLTAQIADLKTRLADLETRQTESATLLAEAQGRIDALETAVDAHTETLAQLETIQAALDTLAATTSTHESLLVGENSALADLQRQITLSRAVELLSRARLYLFESNFGLARQDVQGARDLLMAVETDMPGSEISNLQEVISRLDLALNNLPSFPVIAAGDVDIAWQLLVNPLANLPVYAPTPEPVTETPTAEITPTVTP